MATMDEALGEELANLEGAGLLRVPRVVQGALGPEIVIDGRSVICLCSNDYLGLAGDPRVRASARSAIDGVGVGAGASRLISGTMSAHLELEVALARFTEREAALTFATGWATNVGVLAALVGRGDVVFSDALNHASIVDGCRLSRATVIVYPHADTHALADLVERHRPRARRALVVTDAVFSMDGDRARLRELRAICDRTDAWLMVDEAHALGVHGPAGRGLSAELGVSPEILMGTLGKALGVAGAFVAGSAIAVRYLQNRTRSHVFSTAPPPAIAAAARTALEIAERADDRRDRVMAHAARLRDALRSQGWDARGNGTAIVPVRIGDPETTMRISNALFERGVFAHGIRPPTVPRGTCRIRAVPTAAHDDGHIDGAIRAFAGVREAHG